MGGPMRKPTGRRQRRNKPVLGVIQGKGHATPKPPNELDVRGREDWRRWWGSRLGKLADPEVDLPSVRRLFALRQERDDVAAKLRSTPTTTRGSRRQPVLSPLVRRQTALDTEIRLLETAIERRLLERSQFGVGDEPGNDDGDLNGFYGHQDED